MKIRQIQRIISQFELPKMWHSFIFGAIVKWHHLLCVEQIVTISLFSVIDLFLLILLFEKWTLDPFWRRKFANSKSSHWYVYFRTEIYYTSSSPFRFIMHYMKSRSILHLIIFFGFPPFRFKYSFPYNFRLRQLIKINDGLNDRGAELLSPLVFFMFFFLISRSTGKQFD